MIELLTIKGCSTNVTGTETYADKYEPIKAFSSQGAYGLNIVSSVCSQVQNGLIEPLRMHVLEFRDNCNGSAANLHDVLYMLFSPGDTWGNLKEDVDMKPLFDMEWLLATFTLSGEGIILYFVHRESGEIRQFNTYDQYDYKILFQSNVVSICISRASFRLDPLNQDMQVNNLDLYHQGKHPGHASYCGCSTFDEDGCIWTIKNWDIISE